MGERGQPVLVFLHGFPEGAFVWDALLVHFAAKGYRCIAPNLRGFEKSTAPPEVEAYQASQLVKDIAALIAIEGGQLECLIAHDWGGVVAWDLANQLPHLIKKLAIVNAPHMGTYVRDLKNSPAQQQAGEYINFFIHPTAAAVLSDDDYRLMWTFFANTPQTPGNRLWLTDTVKAQYREVWNCGLTGGLNLYRATPVRPARGNKPGVLAVDIPRSLLTVEVPTLVIWADGDTGLLPNLLHGLEDFVPTLTVQHVPHATHWIVHEQPALVAEYLAHFIVK